MHACSVHVIYHLIGMCCFCHVCLKYQRSSVIAVRPHVSEEGYKKTELIAEKFRIGIGHYLHSKLLEIAEKDRNWVIYDFMIVSSSNSFFFLKVTNCS